MASRTCALCDSPPTGRGAKYCAEHRWVWRENRVAAVRAANERRWAAWRAAGVDPSHGGEAGKKRGEAIARSNREKPRRRKN